nr:glycoside hydrolase family 15 protein [Croceibacterium mercuriale]
MEALQRPNRTPVTHQAGQREDGYLPLEDYGALGEGRSVALSGADGSIDWWCVPNLDSQPLFDRLLDPEDGGRFVIQPEGPFTVERHYRHESNVLETVFTTPDGGRAKLTESMNSGNAGRLPWAELARRVDGLDGSVRFRVEMRPGRRADGASPYKSRIGNHDVFHVERMLGLFLTSDGVTRDQTDEAVIGNFTVTPGSREVLAIVAGEDEPLVVPPLDKIDSRIDLSDQEWRDWAHYVEYAGEWRDDFIRSVLALKLLLYSPSGAIAAAATTSLPEAVGGRKNYDYRYAWVRDAGYTIKAFLAAGAQAEAKAALTWLLKRLQEEDLHVMYRLDGGTAPQVKEIDVPGWRRTGPVRVGNVATDQHQHGIYGDIFETVARFVACGNLIDSSTAELLVHIADRCADHWRRKDSGIWELPEEEHYTTSKISCWQALARAVELVDQGQLPNTCRDRWCRERDRIAHWIEENCWSETQGAYVLHPGTDRLDAAMVLAVRFGFGNRGRLERTLDTIDQELGSGPFHYRYSDVQVEEGCFLACSFWMIEARALLGQKDRARDNLRTLVTALDRGVGIYSEMVDPRTGAYLGNLPQGLTHLAHIMAIEAIDLSDD